MHSSQRRSPSSRQVATCQNPSVIHAPNIQACIWQFIRIGLPSPPVVGHYQLTVTIVNCHCFNPAGLTKGRSSFVHAERCDRVFTVRHLLWVFCFAVVTFRGRNHVFLTDVHGQADTDGMVNSVFWWWLEEMSDGWAEVVRARFEWFVLILEHSSEICYSVIEPLSRSMFPNWECSSRFFCLISFSLHKYFFVIV